MALQYELVRAVLVFELVLFVLLELPLPYKQRVKAVKALRKSAYIDSFVGVAKVFLSFIALLFLDALVRSVRLGKGLDAKTLTDGAHHAFTQQQIHSKMFYAQRNLYLTGFTLALAVVLFRYIRTLMTLVDTAERLQSLEASGAERRKSTAKQVDELEKLRAECATLRTKAKDAEAIAKQAKAQQAEYDRLIDHCNALEAKLRNEDHKSK